MHCLPRPAAGMAKLFECRIADQIGPGTVEGHGRTHAALFERRTFRHPDQEPTDRFQCEEASFLPGIDWLRKERIILVFHMWDLVTCPRVKRQVDLVYLERISGNASIFFVNRAMASSRVFWALGLQDRAR
jgi:hypothetical protein